MAADEVRHVYEVAEMLDDGAIVHLRCPTCGKEVLRTLAPNEARPGERTSTRGYRVLRDEQGALLQGDFTARHSWAVNMSLAAPGLEAPGLELDD
jgi:hypothetical protein